MKKLLILIGLVLIMGCNSTHKITIPKGSVVNMKIKTLEELLASRELILPKEQSKYKPGTWYLEDGTKIQFQWCTSKSSRYMSERIYSPKYPFVEFAKEYSCQTDKLLLFNKFIKDVSLGVTKIYNERGEITKKINYGERLGYKNILKWADKRSYLDLKHIKVLEGRDFDLDYHEIKPEHLEQFRKDFLREFKDEKVVEKLLTHKVLWIYTILYKQEYRSFVFSKQGEFLYSADKKPIRTYSSGEEME